MPKPESCARAGDGQQQALNYGDGKSSFGKFHIHSFNSTAKFATQSERLINNYIMDFVRLQKGSRTTLFTSIYVHKESN